MAFFYDASTYDFPQPIGDKLITINYNNDLREVLHHKNGLAHLSFTIMPIPSYVRLGNCYALIILSEHLTAQTTAPAFLFFLSIIYH